MALQIRSIHHIVLTVSDIDRSTKFYEQVLGAESTGGMNALAVYPVKRSYCACSCHLLNHYRVTVSTRTG